MPIENNQAKPLKVERPTVTKLMITGAPRLDAITVFLEDLGGCRQNKVNFLPPFYAALSHA